MATEGFPASIRRRVGIDTFIRADTETRHWAANAYEDLKGSCPRDTLRSLAVDILDEIYAALLDLENRIREAQKPLDANPTTFPCPSVPATGHQPDEISAKERISSESGPVDNVSIQQDMASAPDMGVPCDIQPQINLRSI